MSLGLDELKKRDHKKMSVSKTPIHEELRPAIKPWSNRGLAKAGVSRKLSIGIDFHVNEDWIEIQAQSFLWFNLNFSFDQTNEDADFKLQRKLSTLEKKFLGSIDRVQNFIRFFGLTTKTT